MKTKVQGNDQYEIHNAKPSVLLIDCPEPSPIKRMSKSTRRIDQSERSLASTDKLINKKERRASQGGSSAAIAREQKRVID